MQCTPQGGVLSLLLFNIRMCCSLSLLTEIPGTILICYGDDSFIHSNSQQNIQLVLHDFSELSTAYGLVIFPLKKFLLKPQNTPRPDHGKQSCPSLLTVLLLIQVIQIIPAQQRIHPILKDLDWLQQCFPSVKWLANYTVGVFILLAQTI